MSEAEQSDGRRRRSRRGLRLTWMWVVVGVIVLLLGVNLAMSLPQMIRGETPDGYLAEFLSADRMRHIGLWLALLPAAIAGVQGARWAHEAFLRSERPAALWLRRAFIVSLTAWIALLIVIMDIDAFSDRTAVGISAAALFSVAMIPFAMAARAASHGRYGGRGASDGKVRRRRRSSSETRDGDDA